MLEKFQKKIFVSERNCIWIGIVKLSIWWAKYFSLVDNVLISSPKILHVNKIDFSQQHNVLRTDPWIWQSCCDADFNSVWACLRCSLAKVPLKRDFLDIYLTRISESVTSKIQNLWGSFFYSKCFNFRLDFKNAAKYSEKGFCFSDNCIWIGILELSLWRAKYFSSVASLLTSSAKIWNVDKTDFFERNIFSSDQWIW